MTIEEAHRQLDEYYSKASGKWVDKPVAWACYQVWKTADSERERKLNKNV